MYYVYIMTNKSNTVLYTGVTNDIYRRVSEHKSHMQGFTAKYKVDKCVFAQEFVNIRDALECEKKIKSGSRNKKFDLIRSVNPEMKDLSVL